MGISKRNNLPIFTLLGLLFISTCCGESYENMTQLLSDIFTNYNPDVRPLNNQSEQVKINASVLLYGISRVDSVNGILTLVAAVDAKWIDERLSWTPSVYGGIESLTTFKTNVWTPGFTLGTPIKFQQLAQDWMKAKVYSNGLVYFSPGDTLESACTMTMRYWPFDKQLCLVTFYPSDYDVNDIAISPAPPGLLSLNMVKNSEWILEDYEFKVSIKFNIPKVAFILKLKRQPMFYVLSIILPLTGLFLINVLVFYLPQESGERVSYAMTITLALAVFLTVVADEMPKSSQPMSLMCVFILMGVVNSLLIMIITVLNMRWYFKEDNSSPKFWHKVLVRISRCQLRLKVQAIPEKHDNNVCNEKPVNYPTEKDRNMLFHPRAMKECTDEPEITWQDVSHAVDVICFWIFLIFSTIFCIICNIYIAAVSDYDDSNLPFSI